MKKLIYITLMAGTLLFGAGCGKGFLSDLEINPNQPSDAPAELILPSVLNTLATNVSDGNLYRSQGLWLGYFSIAGGYAVDDNGMTYYVDQSGPQCWDNWVGALKNADYMEKKAASQANMEYFVAAARILKSFGYQYLVDAYDKVPYTSAFQGVKNFFPQYDEGQAIYASCIAQLDSAINIIQSADPNKAITLGNNDILFQGNMAKWLKLANSIKLRFLLRQSGVMSGSDIAAAIAQTASAGFLGLGDDALVNPGYLNSDGKQNPMWSRYGTNAGGSLISDGYNYIRAGGAGVAFFADNNDPRLAYVYAPNGSSPGNTAYYTADYNPAHYYGLYYGDRDNAKSQANTAGIGHGVMKGPDKAAVLMLAGESLLLQSEAALNGWLPGADPKDLFQKGITASFEYLGVGDSKSNADAAAQTYYSQNLPLVNWDQSVDKQEAIIVQKWAALNSINIGEAWAEFRRTGFPGTDVLPLTKYPGNSRHIANRYLYPKTEADRNKEAYAAAGAASVDAQNTKIFWMK